MYEIREEILNNMKDEFKAELVERGYDYSDFAIDKIFEEWFERKQSLLELLSKHPNWVPERLMIQFDEDFSRKIDVDAADHFYTWLRDNTNAEGTIITEGKYFWDTVTLLNAIGNSLFSATYVEENREKYLTYMNEYNPNFKFRAGMKATKIMRKICKEYGWDTITAKEFNRNGEVVEYNAFEREYAKYADAMCPIKVTRHTCISLNPLDYLLMSHGNSWRSCHYIGYTNDYMGEYSSGTISYMLDEHSIIFYTIDASYDGDAIELEPKLQRQVFGYNDYQLLQSRLYPQSNDCGANDIYSDIRATMQKVIADCLEMPNMWVKGKAQNVWTGGEATCYADWPGNSLCSVSTLKEKKGLDLKAIVMGQAPICIECGGHHDRHGNISCCRDRVYCDDCGEVMDSDYAIYIDDVPYCSHCVDYCHRCGEYHREESYWIDSEKIYVCESCLDYYYRYCSECDNYHRIYDTVYLERYGYYVCDNCLHEHYTQCEKCSDFIKDNDITCIADEDGNFHSYCEDCAKK